MKRHPNHQNRPKATYAYLHFFVGMLFFISGAFTVHAAAFPLSETFDGALPADWVLRSDAVWNASVGGEQALRLTTAAADQNGLGFYDSSFSSNNGIVAEFRYYAAEGDGADGIAFFLVDGDQVSSTTITAGAYGGALGYAQSDVPADGIPHAYLGVGFDEFGNFVVNNEGKEGGLASSVPHSVGLRGSGNGTTGYAYLTSTDISSTLGETIDGGWRQARVTIVPYTGSSTVRVEMSFDDGATWDTVIDDYTYNEAPPANLKLGFTGSTGGSTNIHAISTLDVTLPVDLRTTLDTASSGPYQRGDSVVYSYDITNNGPNDSATTTITNSLPIGSNGVTNVQWSATTTGNTFYTGTSSTLSPFTLPLAKGERVDIEVTANLGADVVDSDTLDHTVVATPDSSQTDPNPNAAALNIAIATDVPTQAESDALDTIETYAATDGTSTAPTVSDYTDAGVTGVTTDNVAELNTLIAAKDSEEVSTVTEIQSAATTAAAIHTVKAYSDSDGASSTPTVNDYTESGITGVNTDNLDDVNDSIAEGEVQTITDIQSVTDTAVAIFTIKQYATTDGTSTAPTVSDYDRAGVQDVTSSNLAEINQSIATKSASEVDTLDKIKTSVTEQIEKLSRSTQTASRITYGCKDPEAANYQKRVSHKPELCEYAESTNTPQEDAATVSDAELRQQIAALTEQITTLRDRMVELSSGSGNAQRNCSTLSRNLERGMQGEDVRCLQQMLNTLGFPLANAGPGAPGDETIYFAALTFDAVRRYQEANAERILAPIGITNATGYVGPQTIAALRADTPL